jgi:hypothetical protein
MANIRVTCPACKSELELDAAFEGQEVECGNCLEVFKAKAPGSAGSSGTGKIPGAGTKPASGSGRSDSGAGSGRSRPAPRRSRRDEVDDDDYEHDRRRDDYDDEDYGPPPERRSGEGDGAATASMVMGIISLVLVCCWPLSLPLGIAAVVTGIVGLKSRANKGQATAGIVLGVLTICLCGGLFLIGLGNAILNPGRFN